MGLALLSEVKKYYGFLRSEGLKHPILTYQEARILALEGNQEDALGALRNVIAAGWRFWYLDGDPALKSLHDNRGFRSIVSDKDMLVEKERARLEEQWAQSNYSGT